MRSESSICLALDSMPVQRAVSLTSQLGKRVYAVKIHSLFDEGGAEVVWYLKQVGAKRVWIDAKLHDTPHAVRERMAALACAGADIVTVHVSGGREMMKAALEGAAARAGAPVAVWGILLLTSLTPTEIASYYGSDRPVKNMALERAVAAQAAGLAGFVCSAHEARFLTNVPQLREMLAVVPGTRSAGVPQHDQKRSATPAQAIEWGAQMIVVGREITSTADPVAAFEAFASGVEAAFSRRCVA